MLSRYYVKVLPRFHRTWNFKVICDVFFLFNDLSRVSCVYKSTLFHSQNFIVWFLYEDIFFDLKKKADKTLFQKNVKVRKFQNKNRKTSHCPNFFVHILAKATTSYFHSEISRPLHFSKSYFRENTG